MSSANPTAAEQRDLWVARHARAEQEGRDDDAADAKRKVGELNREIEAEKRIAEYWARAPKPESLPNMPPAPELPADPTPSAFDAWVRDIARCANTPLDYPVSATWVAAGAATGRRVGLMVCPNDSFVVIPNLWGAIVGDPSLRKSTPVSAAFKPLQGLETEAAIGFEENEVDRIAIEAQLGEMKRVLGKARKDNNGVLPSEDRQSYMALQDDLKEAKREIRYVGTDPTVPKLGEMLVDNPVGVLLYRDELAGFFSSLKEAGREQDRAFYLTAWNGDKPYTFDRILRGTKRIPHVCVSVFGSTQPDVLESVVRSATRGGESNDGLLQRFQVLVYPEKTPYERPAEPPNEEARRDAAEIFRRLTQLTGQSAEASVMLGGGVPYLRFTRDAQSRYYEWDDALQLELRSGDMHPTMVAHLAKYASFMPSLALIDHLVDVGHGPVGIVSVEKAIRLCAYYRKHAERIFSPNIAVDINAARLILKKIQSGAVEKRVKASRPGDAPGRFRPRDIYRAQWTGLDDLKEVEQGIRCLAEYGHVMIEEPKKGQMVVYINPLTKEQNAGRQD